MYDVVNKYSVKSWDSAKVNFDILCITDQKIKFMQTVKAGDKHRIFPAYFILVCYPN